jgi:diacylglycerol O-acyltransferase / wax synthase
MAPTPNTRRMSTEDAWFLYFEKPHAPLHIGSVGIYDGTVPFEKFRASLDARMHLIPRYRQRAVIPPFYAGHPTWDDDPAFSIDRHLRLVQLPGPGTRKQLRELSSKIFAEMLPRDRPLWDITVVHGLEDGSTAYVSRVHHCLVDGVSGIELLLAVLDLVPEPEPTPPPKEPWNPKEPPGPLEAWAEAVFEHWQENLRALSDLQQDLLDPRANIRRMTDFARALEEALPVAFKQPAKMIWNKPIGPDRAVAWNEFSFQEVRGIRNQLGGTVNDVVLTILGGALGRYLRAHGQPTQGEKVRVQIPVNVRKEDEKGQLGNRVSMMLPEIPLDITDPAKRLTAVREQMERLKARDQASAFNQLLKFSENLPAAYHALAGMGGVPQGTLNFVCTNVPGPMIPLYSVGHRLIAHYPMVPIAGDLGIGVGVTSFDKSLYSGVMCDPKIVPDVETIGAYIDQEFSLLRTAASVPASDLPPAIGIKPNSHYAARHGSLATAPAVGAS